MAIGSIGSTTVSTGSGASTGTASDVMLKGDEPAIAGQQPVRGSTKGNAVDLYL